MKKPCEKCYNLRVTIGWSARPQITERGSGKILSSPYIDRLLNDEFYPAENKPEDNLDKWPTCPKCLERLEPDSPELEDLYGLPAVDLTEVYVTIGAVFLVLLLLLIVF